MCGLVGVFNKSSSRGFTDEMRDTFAHLLLIDTLRGEDSTGVFMVERNGDAHILKEATTGSEFLKTNEWKKMRTASWNYGAALIGHNRKATRGNVNDENAHPFIVDDQIVLVHNGGIWGDHKQHADVEVDSHAIAHLLHKHDTVEEALGKFHGAFALMWYDVEKEQVNIIRNKERPLWWMETDDMWVWASEKAMLMFTAARIGLKVKQGPHLVEEHALNTFTLQRHGGWSVDWRKVEPKRETTFPSKTDSNDPPFDPNVFEKTWKEQMDRALLAREDECGECEEGGGSANEDTLFTRPKGVLDATFFSTVGALHPAQTSVFERSMADHCNKFITAAEFNIEVAAVYNQGLTVRCRCFEYTDDGQGGYYLYASPLEDDDIIFRHHFTAGAKPTENRLMYMACNGWIVDIQVGAKCWSPFKDGDEERAAKGYCVILSTGLKIIEGGPYKNGELELKGEKNAV